MRLTTRGLPASLSDPMYSFRPTRAARQAGGELLGVMEQMEEKKENPLQNKE